ncbi:hypothetical protein IMZ48_27490 [Candidatus Bathyarchaeota archaeon]|nr:hypothetical protein [Candidatus Bathyarchaeota archaeon]
MTIFSEQGRLYQVGMDMFIGHDWIHELTPAQNMPLRPSQPPTSCP